MLGPALLPGTLQLLRTRSQLRRNHDPDQNVHAEHKGQDQPGNNATDKQFGYRLAGNGAVVDKDIFSVITRDETVTLLVVKPFYFTLCHLLLTAPFLSTESRKYATDFP